MCDVIGYIPPHYVTLYVQARCSTFIAKTTFKHNFKEGFPHLNKGGLPSADCSKHYRPQIPKKKLPI